MYSNQQPTPVQQPQLVLWNYPLAYELGLSALSKDEEAIAPIFSGNDLPEGAQPLAQAYAGHQFGHFNILGDGRAILLGEQITPQNKRFDIQLKGSGRTPYSRRGDGRATLSSMLREYLISEVMYNLGIPTTRSLAVVSTGEQVYRQPIQEGGILTRIAASHIRVGTFEYLRQYGSNEDLKAFTAYVIQRHYPQLTDATSPALALLEAVMDKQIHLVVEWMRVGFIHGVMNTDNVSISGETIDYGPCAFMNAYDPLTVFSSIDRDARYAYGKQPNIAHWNLAVFAGTLLPLLGEDEEKAGEQARAVLDEFPRRFAQVWYQMMFRKLGLINPTSEDQHIVDDLLQLMGQEKVDYTNFFVTLQSDELPTDDFYASPAFQQWHDTWNKRITEKGEKEKALELMRKNNPIAIARNHLVESALATAVAGNLGPFNALLQQLANPYDYSTVTQPLQQVPAGFDDHYQTFCGT